MQTIIVAGRIGKDAETRQAGQDTVTSFTVAADQRVGRGEKTTNWWRCSIWGRRGEALANYLTKGASVTVCGEFTVTEYDGKSQLNIRVSEVTLQGGKSEGGQRHSGGTARDTSRDWGRTGSQQAIHRPTSFADDLDDDVPF